MKIELIHKNSKATIATLGAELITLEKEGVNYIWTVDEKFWNKTSPILFPIVGRLRNDSYSIDNKNFSLPRHGFARNYEFNIIQQTSNSVVFCLESDATTLKNYPFEFQLLINYLLDENGLKIAYSVLNKSDRKMPFSIGAHPAFAIDSNFSDCKLVFNSKENLVTHHLEKEQFTGETTTIGTDTNEIALNYSLFEKDALVFKKLNATEISLIENGKTKVKVSFEGFPYLGIWTKPNAPFLCIEPWCGLADSVSDKGSIYEKEGIIILEVNETFNRKIEIDF